MEWKEKLFYSLFSCVSSILVEWEFENVGFSGWGKTRVSRENPWSRARTNNKLGQHVHVCQWAGIKPGYIGGRQVLSVLCQSCSPISKHWILVLTCHCSYLMIKRMNNFKDIHVCTSQRCVHTCKAKHLEKSAVLKQNHVHVQYFIHYEQFSSKN